MTQKGIKEDYSQWTNPVFCARFLFVWDVNENKNKETPQRWNRIVSSLIESSVIKTRTQLAGLQLVLTGDRGFINDGVPQPGSAGSSVIVWWRAWYPEAEGAGGKLGAGLWHGGRALPGASVAGRPWPSGPALAAFARLRMHLRFISSEFGPRSRYFMPFRT